MERIPQPTEHQIQTQILQWLRAKGYFCWRQNTGAVKFGKDFVRFGVKGAPDIFAVQNGTGRIIAIEVKRPGKKPSEDQVRFLDEITSRGGIALVAYSVDDLSILQ